MAKVEAAEQEAEVEKGKLVEVVVLRGEGSAAPHLYLSHPSWPP